VLDFPSTDGQLSKKALEERQDLIKERILARVFKAHSEFLNTLPSRPNIDFEKVGTWHHKFDVNALPDIPQAALPPKPGDQNKPSSFA